VLEKLRLAHRTVHHLDADDDEHLAALELMLLVALADKTVRVTEIDEIRDEVEAGGWETGTFNYQSMFGTAMANVRALGPADRDGFVAERASRIANDDLRGAVAAGCRTIAEADGQTDDREEAIVSRIAAALGA
jgi:uncharacterized tellurite resistance protein B-like protein